MPPLKAQETSESFFVRLLPKRKDDSRKGENGRVMVIGGSRVYHGAPFHAAKGAQAAGVDLVYLAVPSPIVAPLRSLSPDFIVYPLPDQKFTLGVIHRLLKWMPSVDSIVIGPGIEKMDTHVLYEFLSELSPTVQVVIDAGAIQPGLKIPNPAKTTFTPHAGEFKRLTGLEIPKSLEERVPIVTEQAGRLNCVILQKGHGDVISNGPTTYINRTGCSAMTVGGTGDVLAGLVAGFEALGMRGVEAAAMASFANGMAGTKARAKFGNRITASDLYDELREFMAAEERKS